MDWVKETENSGKRGVLLFIYLQPGASKTILRGPFGTNPVRLKISVQAPPSEGAANRALMDWLSTQLSISKSKIFIMGGEHSRQKNVWIEGLSRSFVLDSLR